MQSNDYFDHASSSDVAEIHNMSRIHNRGGGHYGGGGGQLLRGGSYGGGGSYFRLDQPPRGHFTSQYSLRDGDAQHHLPAHRHAGTAAFHPDSSLAMSRFHHRDTAGLQHYLPAHRHAGQLHHRAAHHHSDFHQNSLRGNHGGSEHDEDGKHAGIVPPLRLTLHQLPPAPVTRTHYDALLHHLFAASAKGRAPLRTAFLDGDHGLSALARGAGGSSSGGFAGGVFGSAASLEEFARSVMGNISNGLSNGFSNVLQDIRDGERFFAESEGIDDKRGREVQLKVATTIAGTTLMAACALFGGFVYKLSEKHKRWLE